MALGQKSANYWVPMLLALIVFLPATSLIHAAEGDVFTPEERSHWSLQPRKQPAIPLPASGDGAAWLANPVDAFVLASRERSGLTPSPAAARRTLARRLYFNLLGLPPSSD